MKGMTAFGKSQKNDGKYQVMVEISSVNRRHAEIVVKMPSGYQELEPIVRKELASRIGRGQVTVSVHIEPMNSESIVSSPHWQWIEAQAKVAQEIAKRLGVSVRMEKVAVELWKESLRHEGKGECAGVASLLLETLHEAFHEFDAKKKEEGFSLAADMTGRLRELRAYSKKIAELSKGQVEVIREKLIALLQGVVSEAFTMDERVMREVVLQADKADTSEESTRIQHHLDHFEKSLQESQPIGKLLEFILQELLREFNTLGAKNALPEVSTLVVQAKTELEKMREQTQNVE